MSVKKKSEPSKVNGVQTGYMSTSKVSISVSMIISIFMSVRFICAIFIIGRKNNRTHIFVEVLSFSSWTPVI